jgi:serine/threonine protein kinase/formylglycine-generating enzyme required for sulfatase activity
MVESGSNRGGDGNPSAEEADGIASTHESGPGDRASVDADLDVLAVGATVGRYLVVERIGAGAMGVVYSAYDPKLDRKIALKLLRPQRGGRDHARRTARLEREAQAIAKLSHPNVVGIFDVGVHDGQVFMAMEYLAGGTLSDWVAAKKRTWREIVKMFIEVGHGLAGAHAEGLIHRDFKPDNVLLDKNGVPKVVDFGLVRLTGATDLTSSGAIDRTASGEYESGSVAAVPAPGGAAALTRTGALTGTPAYMAPEQFLGKAIDARTDQFAFCVALYEALYGQRPFEGQTIFALADAVTDGRVRAAPKGSDVPGWVRACVLRGLRVGPAERYPGFEQLLAVLANDPVARRRRRLVVAAASMSLVAGVLATRHVVLAKRQEIDRQVAQNVSLADSLLVEAATKRGESKTLRDRALAEFDGYERDKGEELWAKGLAAAHAADGAYQRGIQRLEAAVTLTPDRNLKDRIADALVDYVQMDGRAAAERQTSLQRLAGYDEGGTRAARLNSPATLRIETSPVGFTARIEKYDSLTHRLVESARPVGSTPLELSLPPGSYRLTFDETAAHAGFHYPVLLAAGEREVIAMPVPLRSAIPRDFVYVPEGRFLFGSANEDLRTAFLETAPLHSVSTGAYLISKYETTIGEWIAFLNQLPAKEQELRRPQGKKDGQGGFVDLRKTSNGRWEIRFRATDRTYRAGEGETFQYDDRERRGSQNWSRFPVAGVSPEDALEFAAWLDRSGRVPGARLCSEREWERAARGADAREFPHGNQLLREDANFDLTYGRKSGSYGPDEVGSHQLSVSPFGVYDLVGNVWDLTSSVLDRGQFVARGGSFYQCLKTLWSTNRDPVGSATRDHTIGIRICADAHF